MKAGDMQPHDPTEYTDGVYRNMMLNNARRTATAVTIIAWIVGIVALLSAIGIIYSASQLAKIGNTVDPSTDISTCQSLGGTDPSC